MDRRVDGAVCPMVSWCVDRGQHGMRPTARRRAGAGLPAPGRVTAAGDDGPVARTVERAPSARGRRPAGNTTTLGGADGGREVGRARCRCSRPRPRRREQGGEGADVRASRTGRRRGRRSAGPPRRRRPARPAVPVSTTVRPAAARRSPTAAKPAGFHRLAGSRGPGVEAGVRRAGREAGVRRAAPRPRRGRPGEREGRRRSRRRGCPAARVTASSRSTSCTSSGYGDDVPGGCHSPGSQAVTWWRAPSIVVSGLVATPLPCSCSARSKRRDRAAAHGTRWPRPASGATSGSPATPATTSRSSTRAAKRSTNHDRCRQPDERDPGVGVGGPHGPQGRAPRRAGRRPRAGPARRRCARRVPAEHPARRCGPAPPGAVRQGHDHSVRRGAVRHGHAPSAGRADRGTAGATERQRNQPRAGGSRPPAGWRTLVATIGRHLGRGAGPGCGAAPGEPGRACRPQAPAARRPSGGARRRGRPRAARPERRSSPGTSARRPADTPIRSRQPGRAGRSSSTSSALPRWRRTLVHHGGGAHRVAHAPLAHGQVPAGVEQAQGQIGVLAVGAGEALVEAADALERRSPHHHVGGDPRGAVETGDVALPVGGPAIGGQRHLDAALHRADVGPAGRTSSVSACTQPSGGSTSSSTKATHGAVDARQPTLRAAAGPRPPERSDPDAVVVDRQVERRCRVGAVVDEEHPAAGGQGPGEHNTSPGSDGRPTVGITTSTRVPAPATAAAGPAVGADAVAGTVTGSILRPRRCRR